MKRTLTDKFIKTVKPAPEGKRVEYWETKFDGFGVRVSDKQASMPQSSSQCASAPKTAFSPRGIFGRRSAKLRS